MIAAWMVDANKPQNLREIGKKWAGVIFLRKNTYKDLTDK